MGVLNVTPDSFSDGGKYTDPESAIAHAREMVSAGASIIDVGGESTRPGADPVDPCDEWERIEAVVEALCAQGICVSVDTRHADVARKALMAGASVINDISGFTGGSMVEAVKDSDCGLVVMHMQGTPQTMQEDPTYIDVVDDVAAFLRSQTSHLQDRGISHDRICIDPGPGFGKTASQTLELLRNMHEFVHLGYPVMVAASRKSFITKTYHPTSEEQLDELSAQEALYACELGASVVRTHNVEATVQALSQLRPYCFLGLGSNVALVAEPGEEQEAKIAQINLAIGNLCQLPDTQIIDIAPFYASHAAYLEDQDDFVNTVVLLRTGIPPKELLGYLHIIENSLGRVREVENGPRTLDIDIVDYQLYSFANDELTLPHPRATERDFVVKPMADIAPHHVLANGTSIECVPEDERVGHAWRIS